MHCLSNQLVCEAYIITAKLLSSSAQFVHTPICACIIFAQCALNRVERKTCAEWAEISVTAAAARSREELRGMEPPTEKKARLHFGSLEEQERVRLQTGGSSFSSAVREGILSGNINIAPTTGKEMCACRPGYQHHSLM